MAKFVQQPLWSSDRGHISTCSAGNWIYSWQFFQINLKIQLSSFRKSEKATAAAFNLDPFSPAAESTRRGRTTWGWWWWRRQRRRRRRGEQLHYKIKCRAYPAKILPLPGSWTSILVSTKDIVWGSFQCESIYFLV